jgi:hypothetical protein
MIGVEANRHSLTLLMKNGCCMYVSQIFSSIIIKFHQSLIWPLCRDIKALVYLSKIAFDPHKFAQQWRSAGNTAALHNLECGDGSVRFLTAP